MKSFIDKQIELLKYAIQEGVISKDSSLLEEQKEKIIQIIGEYYEEKGMPVNYSQIGAEIDKIFAEEFETY